jgi:hypothetical protein
MLKALKASPSRESFRDAKKWKNYELFSRREYGRIELLRALVQVAVVHRVRAFAALSREKVSSNARRESVEARQVHVGCVREQQRTNLGIGSARFARCRVQRGAGARRDSG